MDASRGDLPRITLTHGTETVFAGALTGAADGINEGFTTIQLSPSETHQPPRQACREEAECLDPHKGCCLRGRGAAPDDAHHPGLHEARRQATAA